MSRERTNLRNRLIVFFVAILFILFIAGPIGYMLIEGMSFTDAFYMTVITVFTVGFREVRELSTSGQYFTVLVIFFGVFSLFFMISTLIEYTFREALSETLGRRRMDFRIRRLSGHNVVCGFGRVGEVVCDMFAYAQNDFVVIDIDPQRTVEADEKGYLYVMGDATEAETLKDAGIEKAYGLVCALENDADNLFTTLTARFINSELVIVTRCVSPDSVEKLHYAGADRIISPYSISGSRMATYLLKPGVYDYLDLVAHGPSVEYRIEELLVEKGSAVDGRTIGELDIKARTGALVNAVRKADDEEFNTNPGKDTRLDAGDLLIALGTESHLTELEKLIAKKGG